MIGLQTPVIKAALSLALGAGDSHHQDAAARGEVKWSVL
jgi:hypothetical protein